MTTHLSDQAADPERRPGRRRLLGAAVAAGLTGAGVAWWRYQPHDVVPDAAQRLWQSTFVTPTGEPLAMAAFRGKPLLVNFWATWCPPCVEELPLLDGFFQENASNGWQVVGLAIDQPSAVRTFLQKLPVRFPVGLAGLDGTDLGKSLGNLSGALPFSVVFGRDGAVAQRRLGKITAADLTQWLQWSRD
jgi:thiol-disulfide isomerase/thioredoxin